jgi:anti-anti-sigma regulatory factor
MLRVSAENIGDVVVIECEGKIAQDEGLMLRDAVIAQDSAHVLVLDFSRVNAIESTGLGILVSLQYWAQRHDIQFKVFNPTYSVRHRLGQASSMHELEIASLPEVMGLLMLAGDRASLKFSNHERIAA